MNVWLKKVLILEDNYVIRQQLGDMVKEVDAAGTVYAFGNVKDAYGCALEKRIDLFLVDIILDTRRPGDSSGLKFVQNIRQVEHYGFVPVIFITSLEDARAYTYESLHCYSFIEKPFDVNRVKEVIGQCLRFPGGGSRQKTLFFQKDGIVLAVEREDIVFGECISHVMYLHMKQGDVVSLPYVTLRRFLEEADSEEMVQCRRNIVVNRRYVCNVDYINGVIQLKGDYGRVEIGVRFRKYVKECFR